MKRKTKLNNFYRSVLQKRLRFIGLSVLELSILSVVLCGGVSALYLTRHHDGGAVSKPTTRISNSDDTPVASATVATPQQDAAQNNSSAQGAPAKSSTSTTTNLPDQYGCIPQTSGYDSCVKYAKQNAMTLACDSQAKTADDTYSATESQAQAAYDKVIAEWNAVKDQPYQTHSPYNEYATDAKTKYNAIQKPAYATYVGTINSLNAQGCNVVKTYSDTSWAGY